MEELSRFSVRKINNAFVVDYAIEDKEEYTTYEFAYLSIDGVMDKLEEVFKQDGK